LITIAAVILLLAIAGVTAFIFRVEIMNWFNSNGTKRAENGTMPAGTNATPPNQMEDIAGTKRIVVQVEPDVPKF
jgi:hypothetical protein